MWDPWIVTMSSWLPRPLSQQIGRVARVPGLVRAFAWWYRVDLTDCVEEIGDFDTIVGLFNRSPRAGARPVGEGIVSPADGRVAWVGRGVETTPGGVLRWITGVDRGPRDVVVIYLSPRDIHHVHAPLGGGVERSVTVPGQVWPVFSRAVKVVPSLYARNARWIVTIGGVDVVLIGALGVSWIRRAVNTGDLVAPGARIGGFDLGSTVILSAPVGAWTDLVAAGDEVRLGQTIARLSGSRGERA